MSDQEIEDELNDIAAIAKKHGEGVYEPERGKVALALVERLARLMLERIEPVIDAAANTLFKGIGEVAAAQGLTTKPITNETNAKLLDACKHAVEIFSADRVDDADANEALAILEFAIRCATDCAADTQRGGKP